MPAIALSYLDQQFQAALAGQSFTDKWSNEQLPLVVRSTPQARNTTPYQDRAICQGSSSCIPICPIQAKYDATYHVALAASYRPNRVEFRYKSVATQVLVNTAEPSQPISGIQYKTWPPDGKTNVVRGKIYVLAAHAVENAKLLLNSPWSGTTVANSSTQVGCNLADHPVSLVYGLTDEPVYGYRGPLSTAGVESLRDGSFRTSRGAFRMEIGNDGWSWPTGDPFASPQEFMSGPLKLYGQGLALAVADRLARQVRIGCLAEQLPNKNFCVTLSDKMDGLGIPRPQLTYGIGAYGRRSLSAAVAASVQILKQLIAIPVIQYNYTDWNTGELKVDAARSDKLGLPPNIFVREGWAGAGHLMGTHRMGSDPSTSVVDSNQRAHDHPNLYLLGSGSWPSYATGNPTLTITALALRAAQTIIGQLGGS